MTPERVQQRLADITASVRDDEAAHSMEDDLHKDVLVAIRDGKCSDPVECARLALTSLAHDFARWSA